MFLQTLKNKRRFISQKKLLLWFFLAFTAISYISLDKFSPRLVPDTPSYMNIGSLEDMLGGIRTPFYGFVLKGIEEIYGGYAVVPLAQFLFFCMGTYFLYRSALLYGLSVSASIAISLPLLISNVAILYTNYLHPEIVAVTFLLFALGGILRIASKGGHMSWLVTSPLFLSLGYLFKPGFLLFVLAFPMLLLILSLLVNNASKKRSVIKAFTYTVVALIPFFAYSAVRYDKLGDFHIVSFSAYTGLGLSGQIMNIETQGKISKNFDGVIVNALSERGRLEDQKLILPIPISSTYGKPVYWSAVLGYFDVFASNYDRMVTVLANALGVNDMSNVELNKRASAFNMEVIIAEPLNYALYIVGASTRFFGLLFVANLSFVSFLILFIGVLTWTILHKNSSRLITYLASQKFIFDLSVIFLINFFYVIANFIPAVAMTFPALRYVDTAGIFMAAIPTYILIEILCFSRARNADQ